MRNTLLALLIFGVGMSASLANGQITTPERNVQFSSIDFGSAVLTLTNFGTTDQALDGWRFCSHDESEVRRYSATSGLNGMTLSPGESLAVHFNNDASGPGAINASTIGGGFAQPLDQLPASNGAYGIQIYITGNFGNGNFIADHLQWSYNGADNNSADDRSDEAQMGGVWTDQSAWISVDETTRAILLNPGASEFENNSPADYSIITAGISDIATTELTVFRGVVVSGAFADTIESDDTIMGLNPGFTLNATEPPVWITHEGVLPLAGPVGLEVVIESQANTVGLTQTIEAFNYTTGAFVEMDARPATFNTDSVATINLDAVANVDSETGEVQIRTSWRATGFVLLFPWQVSIDQVGWQAEY